ncbi:hypothetical protein GCM10022251_49820 [Phytohabitans flavus]|uniref:Uncharacterized protein n=1 Tax=Phytohabitans flavus TaxID=1076124 RepID=A0A6F8XSF0_9ACTN|nr:hypothetical protein Pflav_031630 [Phytohabitans flavus]
MLHRPWRYHINCPIRTDEPSTDRRIRCRACALGTPRAQSRSRGYRVRAEHWAGTNEYTIDGSPPIPGAIDRSIVVEIVMRDTVWQVAREPWTHWYAPACRAPDRKPLGGRPRAARRAVWRPVLGWIPG